MINNSNINDNKLRILVVDDSRIFRGIIERIIGERESLVVVGSARNGLKALEFLDSNNVDLVTLDVNMPDMDGFETLEVIEQMNKKRSISKRIGVIMVSEYTHKGADVTIRALENGAFNFVTKPKSASSLEENFTTLSEEIVSKINNFLKTRLNGSNRLLNLNDKTCTGTKLTIEPKSPEHSDNEVDKIGFHSIKAIVIGVSTGGPKALVEILPELSDKVNVPIFIVQHMPPTFTKSLANSLDSKCRHKVIESCDNGTVESDHIITAITTNETSFYRDNHIFESFNSYILPKLDKLIKQRSERKIQRKGSKVRIWCAASSTGQEPYCIAMLIDEYVSKNRHHNIKNSDFEVLATDISSKVLAQAISGEFTTMEAARGLSSSQIERYFSKVDGKLLLNQNIRDMVEFRRLNLIEPFTMLGGFDVIFCRNVLIYFDGSTKKKIMDQFHYMLPDDGFLILGASESTYGTTDKFDPIYINTSIIYKK